MGAPAWKTLSLLCLLALVAFAASPGIEDEYYDRLAVGLTLGGEAERTCHFPDLGLRLGPQTRVHVRQVEPLKLELESGRVFVKTGRRLVVETPTASVSASTSEFLVQTEGPEFHLFAGDARLNRKVVLREGLAFPFPEWVAAVALAGPDVRGRAREEAVGGQDEAVRTALERPEEPAPTPTPELADLPTDDETPAVVVEDFAQGPPLVALPGAAAGGASVVPAAAAAGASLAPAVAALAVAGAVAVTASENGDDPTDNPMSP